VSLPHRFVFPFGYVVSIHRVSAREMRKLQGDADYKASPADGLWSVDTQTISVLKSLPLRRQRYILSHELGHAWLDWQHFCLTLGVMKP
jgi:Zn-dependent peptidase ImmA (M78 family)